MNADRPRIARGRPSGGGPLPWPWGRKCASGSGAALTGPAAALGPALPCAKGQSESGDAESWWAESKGAESWFVETAPSACASAKTGPGKGVAVWW